MNPSVCAIIPARGGSKGLPGKNQKYLNGHPLLAHSIRHAKAARCIDRVFVSTDCAELARIAFEYEAEVPLLRPKELASDTSPVIDAVEHLLENIPDYTPDYVVLLQPTSPLRMALDIDRAFAQLLANEAPAIVSVSEASTHPLLCKRMDETGTLKPFVEHMLNGARRQDLPPAYALNGAIYMVKTDVLIRSRSWCPAEAGAYAMPVERSVDIDTEMDFEWAEWILQRMAEAKAA